VHVPAETTVTLDHEDDTDLVTVRVDGTLRTDPESAARLRPDTLVVTGSGTLELGRPTHPTSRGRRSSSATTAQSTSRGTRRE